MPRRKKQAFILIPPERKTKWTCTINEIDVSDYILSASFTMGLIGEDTGCEIELENSGEQYNDVFLMGHNIVFKMDFDDGSTTQWKGKVEKIQNLLNNSGFILKIGGSHLTARLLDITVTKEYTNTSVSNILRDLIAEYLT